MEKYTITKTPTHPRCWKINHLGYTENNSWTEYFCTKEEAMKEINRRNGVVVD